MCIQLIWKRLLINQVPLSFHCQSTLIPLAFYAKPFANFCTARAAPSTTPHTGVVTDFLINKCALTPQEIAIVFRHHNELLRRKSSQNMEEVLKLLNGCGLTTPAQIRKVVFSNPLFFFLQAQRNLQYKLSLFRTFMKEKDIARLLLACARAFHHSEARLKSAVLLLQKLGIEGEALSELLVKQPRFLTVSEEKVIQSFKQADDLYLGFKKGSKMFARLLKSILGTGQENIARRRQCLRSLGFSENQILQIWRNKPATLSITEQKIKRNVDFVVKTAGLSLADVVKYPNLFAYSVETRMLPRYRVMEALKSMHVQVLTKKGNKKGLSFLQIVHLTEKCFLENYVNSKSESSSLLLDIYHGKREIWKAEHGL